ncbi:MAG: glycerophosphodiester phosphodiesterase family protein [Deltaproteobacteria bacterium]|nr:glycerophosphodiester phosphodiesterase family protein [Deltaproteobacteria bacterium]
MSLASLTRWGLTLALLLALTACQDPTGEIFTPAGLLERYNTMWSWPAAHRGKCAAGVPENTLAAIDSCEERRIALIELDLRVSADGVVFLMHDADVERTTDGELRFPGRTSVDELTAGELRSLVIDDPLCHAAASALPRRCRVPTLAEALASTRESVLLLDYKGGSLEAIAATLEAGHPDSRRTIFLDSSLATLREMQVRLPELQLMPRAANVPETEAFLTSGLSFSWLHGDTGWLGAMRETFAELEVRPYANVFDLDVGISLAAETLSEEEYEAFLEETIRPTLMDYRELGLVGFGTESPATIDRLLNGHGGFGCCPL